MPLASHQREALASRVLATNRARMFNLCVGGLSRERVRGILDRAAALLEANPTLLATVGRERTEEWLVERLASDDERVGVIPMFVFAIILKVIVSMLIDWWLMARKAAE